jgi:NAD(P)-dependent dehydrogenase (short-subunit alcohol dehydrogenase family)
LSFKKLESKVALVTGSSSGIGKAIALAFAREGASVAVNGFKNIKGIKDTVDLIKKNGGISSGFRADVSDIKDVKNMIEGVVREYERIDILVNNSGISQESIRSRDNIIDLEEKDWDKVISINLKSIFLTSKFALPYMKKQGS